MRHLTTDEREVLRAVLLAGAPEDERLRAALLAQVDATAVAGPSCDCGCASLALTVDRAAAPPAPVSEVSADALNGDAAVGFRVKLVDGYLNDVEFYSYGDADDTAWPAAHLIR